MEYDIDTERREITVTLTNDEAHWVREAIDRLRANELFTASPVPDATLNNLLAALADGNAKMNAPTACCSRVLPDNHPGCACLLERLESTAWCGVAEAAERAREQPTVDDHHTDLKNRIKSARINSVLLAEHRRSVSEFEKENNQ